MQTSVAKVQVQPVPLIAVAVNPVGSVSVTVTVPLVEALPLLVTVMVYCAPVCPCVKLPTWVFVMVRSGWRIVVGSLAVLLAVFRSAPFDSDTVTLLVTVGGALLATLTVRVKVELLPTFRAVVRVQTSVAKVQLQPEGLGRDVAVKPVSNVSVRVIVPLVAAIPLFDTVIV